MQWLEKAFINNCNVKVSYRFRIIHKVPWSNKLYIWINRLFHDQRLTFLKEILINQFRGIEQLILGSIFKEIVTLQSIVTWMKNQFWKSVAGSNQLYLPFNRLYLLKAWFFCFLKDVIWMTIIHECLRNIDSFRWYYLNTSRAFRLYLNTKIMIVVGMKDPFLKTSHISYRYASKYICMQIF